MKIQKIIRPLLIGISLETVVMPLFSCANSSKFKKEAETIFNASVEEFKTICNYPHPTFGTRQICDYIKKTLRDSGYTEVFDIDDLENQKKFFEDDYRATEYTKENSSGNLYFNIPATIGWEEKQGLTLQAHMDMVLDNIPEGEELTRKIVPVLENDTIHTKDYQTSLGADDGVGLALILSLAKNPNIIEHGPIRCLITADEEDGVSGASKVTYKGLKYNYLINLDGENINQIAISAAGTKDIYMQGVRIDDQFIEEIDKSATKEYQITVSGLRGGHSAADINENRACAIQLVNDVVNVIKTWTPSLGGKFNLIQMESNNKNNAIADKATIWFATSLDFDTIQWLINMKKDQFLKSYSVEQNIQIDCEAIINERHEKGLTVPGSRNILDLIPQCLFGPIHWLDDERREVKTSCNLSNLVLDLSKEGTLLDPQFKLEHLIRSVSELDVQYIQHHCQQLADDFIEEMMSIASQTIIDVSSTPPWDSVADEEYRKLVSNAFINAGEKETKMVNVHGWLEPGYFYEKYHVSGVVPHMISVGPTINDSHNRKETLHLSTYKKMIQATIYVINKINDVI